jgi:hypothetical protein
VRKAREIGAPQTQLGHIASPPARRDSRKCPKSQKVPGDYAKLEFAKTLIYIFFRNCMAAMLWQMPES